MVQKLRSRESSFLVVALVVSLVVKGPFDQLPYGYGSKLSHQTVLVLSIHQGRPFEVIPV